MDLDVMNSETGPNSFLYGGYRSCTIIVFDIGRWRRRLDDIWQESGLISSLINSVSRGLGNQCLPEYKSDRSINFWRSGKYDDDTLSNRILCTKIGDRLM